MVEDAENGINSANKFELAAKLFDLDRLTVKPSHLIDQFENNSSYQSVIVHCSIHKFDHLTKSEKVEKKIR